ncbi:MAG: ATP-binding protein, partial [Halobacteriales archaeon]|nr:ATP-binding protein [Halobacteriales archaeon]
RAFGDRRRVKQVLRNLLGNAVKYGGEYVLIEGFPHGEHFVVVVSDNGAGIAEGDVNRIFEHFEQVSKGDSRSSTGIGLGLPIARKLARAMGGEVWYEKRFPTGSRFCFSVTLTPETQQRILAERAALAEEAREGVLARR